MGSPDLSVWLISAYALIMLAAAWVVDILGSRSARHSMSWCHSDFVYHDDVDGWRCHEDQWLWPTAFDPDKRVIRYEGAHAICGRCPSKDTCSPTPGPREITRPVDPWPYSDAGRFHRGVGLVIACVGVFVPLLLMAAFHAIGDLIVLGTTAVVIIVTGVLPLARHLWNTPDNAPAHLPHVGSQEYREDEEARRSASIASTRPVPVTIGSRPSGYRSVREAAEAIAAAQARAAASGRTVRVSFVAESDGAGKADGGTAASAEPELRRVAALRTRRRVPISGAELGSDSVRGGARRSWSSVWNEATDSRAR
ncbi:hypothetical protein FK256_04210 [Actinomyces johnsonii]|uniref:Uncharacterized protein n=1 Tax=Actinomyces johnsonii TaxID=544581 RepID=A0A508A627_9ACTO|nr:hypothetical protein [Actinomyces johnsonii]KAA8740186.1 hypothetical protein F4W10_09105 [Actinomyces johnsonii]TQD44243.1 hypothetical protein FK256_04210 [Actinomyces johnsonii]